MSKPNEKSPWKEPETCDECGEVYLSENAHRTACEATRNDSFDGKTCGMCGQQYTDYMHHLTNECDPSE